VGEEDGYMVTFVVRLWTPPDAAAAEELRGVVEQIGHGEGPRTFRSEEELLEALRAALPAVRHDAER